MLLEKARNWRATACAAALVAVLAPAASAQVMHQLTGAARMSDAQLDTIVATATPMERLVDPSAPAAQRQSAGAVASDVATGPVASMPGFVGRPMRAAVREAAVTDAARGAMRGEEIAPQNYGINSEDTIFHYNDYLQNPSWMYPYRAAGKMFFTFNGSSWFSCTAALINYVMIVTAGHCVHEGGNGASGWIQQAYFYPGYDSTRSAGGQLFGRCDLLQVGTTSQWFDEGDIGEGYDVAVGACSRLSGARYGRYENSWPGFRVGYLGFCYENCRRDYHFLTQLGYPGNYYSGGRMTTSQHLSATGIADPVNTSIIQVDYMAGSGMRGGSSGGPHISNIGEIDDSSTSLGQLTDRNIIYAVTSWGYTSHIYKIQGSSPLSGVSNGNNFIVMYNQMCRYARTQHGRTSCDLIIQ